MIVRTARLEQIVLLGSGAAGAMHAQSDLDLLVSMETATPRASAQRLREAAPPTMVAPARHRRRVPGRRRAYEDCVFVTHRVCEHARASTTGFSQSANGSSGSSPFGEAAGRRWAARTPRRRSSSQ